MVMEGTNIKQIFVDEGFSKNTAYIQGRRDGFKGIDVHTVELPHASALGATMLMNKVLLIFLFFVARWIT
jgi:hypothetical protein